MIISKLVDYFKRRKFPFYCPVCEKRIPFWKKFLRQTGENQFTEEPEPRKCPDCNSFERTRHFALYLKKFRIIKRNINFLHFAPEDVLVDNLRKKNRFKLYYYRFLNE